MTTLLHPPETPPTYMVWSMASMKVRRATSANANVLKCVILTQVKNVNTNGQCTGHEILRPPAKNGCRGQMNCKLHNKMKASCAPFPGVRANNNAGGTVVRWAGRWGLTFPSTRLIFSRNFQHALDATPLDLSRHFVRSSCALRCLK